MKRNKTYRGSAPVRRDPDLLWSGSQYVHGPNCDCTEIDCRFWQIVYNDSHTQEES
jgi:hypothetical protein